MTLEITHARRALVAICLVAGCSVPSAHDVEPVTIHVQVTGLAGTGLVLQNLGTDDLAVSADGTFAFATPVMPDMPFSVTVKAQPSSPSQACSVTNGTGIVGTDVADVAVDCTTNTFLITGSVTGLAGGGLVLEVNGADDLTVTSDGTFQFQHGIASGTDYTVTVKTQPIGPAQTCTLTGDQGTVGNANVDTVSVLCQTSVFAVGGTVTGLAGMGLVLQNNGGDDLAITADGPFMFRTPLESGAHYAVTVSGQPGVPSQTCSVTSGSGSVGNTAVMDIQVTCVTRTFTVSGSVSGLAGSGLVLQNNGGDNLAINVNGNFTFSAPVASGAAYAVTVAVNPSSASQTCTVGNGTGTVGSGNVMNVTVTCTTNTYTVGGTISGLSGGGLILRDNGGDDLAIPAGATSFAFVTPVASLDPYAVTVAIQPNLPTQVCTIANGSGTVTSSNIANIAISCTTKSFTIGGTISGLAGSGLVLQDNNGDNLTIAAGATSFTFGTAIASGAMYNVTVYAQPSSPSQTCSVSAGMGTVGSANVTGIVISCAANRYTIGGTVSGLVGSNLVLQNNGGDNLKITAAGSFAFATTVASGGTYSVTVLTQPSSPAQTCTVANGAGTVGSQNVTSVAITCTTNTYTIGGTVTGLAGTGLVLQDNGGDNLNITANGAFTFATKLASGTTYAVTVATQPGSPTQTCTVASGSGTVGGSTVNNVAIACTTNTYAIGGTVSGLAGTGLKLLDNGGNALAVNTNGTFQFTTKLASGSSYSVSIGTQPSSPTQTCVVSAGSGTVTSSDITGVNVTCTTNTYTLGGAVSGLAGAGLQLQNTINGSPVENLAIGASGAFTFQTAVASGSVYSVTVLVQPSNPSQTCTVANGSGTVGASNIASIAITCTTNSYTIGGTLSGLLGSGLKLTDETGATISPAAGATTYAFTAKVVSGGSWSVSITGQPTGPIQSCTGGGMGTVTNANISVAITCPTTAYPVPVSVISPGSNFLRKGLVLQNNGGDALTVSSLGTSTFATQILNSNPYNVTVLTPPLGENCTVANGSGTIQGGPPNPAITVTCVPANLAFVTSLTYVPYQIGGQQGADAACQARAQAAGLDGTYVAWLSTSMISAASRIPASARGWYRTDGHPIADTLASLTGGKILYPISTDETGAAVPVVPFVFTGTANDGTNMLNGMPVATCSDYTDPTGQVVVAEPVGGKGAWSDYSNGPCNSAARLYCLGISYSAAVSVPAATTRTAFVTKAAFIPSGGLTGADALCQQEAAGANLPGTYKAHLATSTATAISRFDTSGPPWARVDHVLLAATASALGQVQNSWLAMPDQAADGSAIGLVMFWGTSGPSLQSASYLCQNWSSTGPTDLGYESYAPVVGYSNAYCSATYVRLLCLQQ